MRDDDDKSLPYHVHSGPEFEPRDPEPSHPRPDGPDNASFETPSESFVNGGSFFFFFFP